MQENLEVRDEGIKTCAQEYTVTEEFLAQHLISKGKRILSTPCLILMMERTARNCLDRLVGDNKTSVGYRIDIRHRKSVNEGDKVRVEARLVYFDGRRAVFHITAYSKGEVVGEGIHERYVVEA